MKKLDITLEGKITCGRKVVHAKPLGKPKMIDEHVLEELETYTEEFPKNANAYVAGEKIRREKHCGHEDHAPQIWYSRIIQFYRMN